MVVYDKHSDSFRLITGCATSVSTPNDKFKLEPNFLIASDHTHINTQSSFLIQNYLK